VGCGGGCALKSRVATAARGIELQTVDHWA
jgi:hypothetical protein